MGFTSPGRSIFGDSWKGLPGLLLGAPPDLCGMCTAAVTFAVCEATWAVAPVIYAAAATAVCPMRAHLAASLKVPALDISSIC